MIDAALQALTQKYVFPDGARKMVDHIRERQRAGAYDQVTSARQLAQALTDDLRSISQDKHLGVHLSEEAPSKGRATSAQEEANRRYVARVNYGFDKVERLEGTSDTPSRSTTDCSSRTAGSRNSPIYCPSHIQIPTSSDRADMSAVTARME